MDTVTNKALMKRERYLIMSLETALLQMVGVVIKLIAPLLMELHEPIKGPAYTDRHQLVGVRWYCSYSNRYYREICRRC